MSTCNHKKQDGFANCCKLEAAQKRVEELEARIKVFPQPGETNPEQPTINTVVEFPLDPRAMLAGFAMAGMLARDAEHYDEVAANSVKYADVLLGYLRG